MAQGCGVVQGFIPTVQTIVTMVNVMFPGIGVAVAGIANAVQSVATNLCNAMPKTVSETFKTSLDAATPDHPIEIGTVTIKGEPITVKGYSSKLALKRAMYDDVRTLFPAK